MKSLRCLFGIHDWEILDVSWGGNKSYWDRVCRRCEKVDDSFSRYGDSLRKKQKAHAKKIFEERKTK